MKKNKVDRGGKRIRNRKERRVEKKRREGRGKKG